LWSIGIYNLKLKDEEFWDITPAQFWALYDLYLADVEHSDYQIGVIAAQIFNVHRGKEKPALPLDYFPHHKKRRAKQLDNRQISPNEAKLRARLESAQFKKLAKAKGQRV
jgi:hypothetical protein